jgi:RNA polymerase primary sigma factor
MYAPVDDVVPDEALLEEESHEWQVTDEDHAELEREQADDAVRLYLREIGRVPLLKKADEVRLAKAIELQGLVELARSGESGKEEARKRLLDENDDYGLASEEIQRLLSWEPARMRAYEMKGDEARKQMIEANLRLVVSVAKKYLGHGMSLLDLIQEGNTGLMRAVEKFDWRRGFKFSTYATWWIRQAVTRCIADQSRTIRVPVHMNERISRYNRAVMQLSQELGREPTVAEISTVMEVSPEKVEEIKSAVRFPISLEKPVGDDEDSLLGDFIEDASHDLEELATKSLLRNSIDEALGKLSDREAGIIRLRYGLSGRRPQTLEEVGGHFGLTRERIRQIEIEALRKLRHPMVTRRIRDYAE